MPLMLPAALYRRMTLTGPLQTERRSNERRRSPRIPCSLRAALHTLSGNRIGPGRPIRVKDISPGGIGLILTRDLQVTGDFIVRLSRPGIPDVSVQCRVRRTTTTGGISLAGCSFEKLLAPDQLLTENAALANYIWLDVAAETTPEDPYADQAAA